jgi:hypothetical protein
LRAKRRQSNDVRFCSAHKKEKEMRLKIDTESDALYFRLDESDINMAMVI